MSCTWPASWPDILTGWVVLSGTGRSAVIICAGHGVYSAGASYVSVDGHVAATDNQPGVGTAWQRHWRLVAGRDQYRLLDKSVKFAALSDAIMDVLADAAPPSPTYARGWLGWIGSPAKTGALTASFPRGVVGRFDEASALQVDVAGGVNSATEDALLDGANVCAVKNGSDYEVLQFRTATLVSGTTYRLTGLLRGQGGTAGAMGNPTAGGAEVLFK